MERFLIEVELVNQKKTQVCCVSLAWLIVMKLLLNSYVCLVHDVAGLQEEVRRLSGKQQMMSLLQRERQKRKGVLRKLKLGLKRDRLSAFAVDCGDFSWFVLFFLFAFWGLEGAVELLKKRMTWKMKSLMKKKLLQLHF